MKWRYLLNLLLACLALLATASAIRIFLPPFVPAIQDKLRHYTQHRDQIDILLLGSSRIYHHIDPAQLDRQMHRAGHNTKTFNFGVSGMMPPESGHVLQTILRHKSPRTKWILVELHPIQFNIEPDKQHTLRALHWHTPQRTLLVLQKHIHEIIETARDVAQAGKKIEKFRKKYHNLHHALTQAALHLKLCFRNQFNLGRGPHILQHLVNGPPPIALGGLGDNRDGYLPIIRKAPITQKDRDNHNHGLNEMARPPKNADPHTENEYRRIAHLIRQTGAQPIFIIPPVVGRSTRYFAGQQPPCPILQFSDLTRHATLYQFTNRNDPDHLNAAGAQAFTHALAEQLLPHIP